MSKTEDGRDLTLWISKDCGGICIEEVVLHGLACNVLPELLKKLGDESEDPFIEVKTKDEGVILAKRNRLVCAFSPSGLKEKYSEDGGFRTITLVFSHGDMREINVETGSALAVEEAIKTEKPFVSILNGPRLVMVCRAESIVCARIPSDRPRNEDEVWKATIPRR